jgi:heme A synthase
MPSMHGDKIDFMAERGVDISIIGIVLMVIVAHFVPDAISMTDEISRGKDNGNVACWLLFLLVAPLCGCMAYRMHDRGYYVFSYPLTWFVPLVFVLLPTKCYDMVHIIPAVTLFVLMVIMAGVFLSRSDYAHVLKIKAAAVVLAFLLLAVGIGVTEKILVVETMVSLYLVNRVI